MAIGVSGIAKASPAVAHLANQTLNDIRHAALAYTFVRKVCAHSCAKDFAAYLPPANENSSDGAIPDGERRPLNNQNPSGFLQRGFAGWTGLEEEDHQNRNPSRDADLARIC